MQTQKLGMDIEHIGLKGPEVNLDKTNQDAVVIWGKRLTISYRPLMREEGQNFL